MRLHKALGIIAAVLCSAQAAAGSYLEASRTDLRDPLRSPETQRMWFDGHSFRLESERADAVEIFKDHSLYLLEPTRRRFAVIEESRLDALAQATAHATLRTESSGGRTCTVWEVTVGGEKVQELCVVPVSAVPGGAQILADMRTIGELIRERRLGERLGSSVADSWAHLDAVEGIPIISRTFEDGHAIVQTRITAVRSEPVPFTAFEIPAGFKRRPLHGDGIQG